MSMRVWARHREAGFHAWPGAPAQRAYLSVQHRHLFGFRVEVDTAHDDRAVEFHFLLRDLRDVLRRYPMLDSDGRDFSHRSCEMIASEVALALQLAGYEGVVVEVDEDGECGAVFDPRAATG